MSYSGLGQATPGPLLNTGSLAVQGDLGKRIVAAAASIAQQASSNRIIVPADCASIKTSGELTKFDVAKELRAGEWYLWAIPLKQTLTDPQAAALRAAFEGAFFPNAAEYPVNVTTPCKKGGARALVRMITIAEVYDSESKNCDRVKKDAYIPHKQDVADLSIKVQRHNKEEFRGRARHYISLYHQFTGPKLEGKKFFPQYPEFIGYRNIEGSPMFVVAFQMNPDPKVDLYGPTGNVQSGNVARGAKPAVNSVLARRLLLNALRKAAGIAGLPSDITTAGTSSPSAIVKLNRVRVEVRQEGGKKKAVREGAAPDPSAGPGRPVTEIRDLPQDYRLTRDLIPVFDSAIDQAAAYVDNGISVIMSLFAGLIAQININSRTDALVKSADRAAGTSAARMRAAKAVLDSTSAFAVAVRTQAEAQLKNPDLAQALRNVQSLRRDVARKVQEVTWGDEAFTKASADIVALAQVARDSDSLIRRGLDAAIARARTHTKIHPSIKRSLECNAIRKARREQEIYPDKLARRAEELAGSATEWATALPQRAEALKTFQELDAFLVEIARRIPLPWWAKPLGPLPVWGWGAMGVGTLLGGAVLVRRRRKKAKARAA